MNVRVMIVKSPPSLLLETAQTNYNPGSMNSLAPEILLGRLVMDKKPRSSYHLDLAKSMELGDDQGRRMKLDVRTVPRMDRQGRPVLDILRGRMVQKGVGRYSGSLTATIVYN
ncbi:MAG: hypothetical protein U5K31_03995 [Balneolaceae bacterium]|nr:hypothetical protein [Balneolaceae bacterium]